MQHLWSRRRDTSHSPALQFALTFGGELQHFALRALQFALTRNESERYSSHSLRRTIRRASHRHKGTASDRGRRSLEDKKITVYGGAEASVNPAKGGEITAESVLERAELNEIGCEDRLQGRQANAHRSA